MLKQPEYEIQQGGEFFTPRSRRGDKPLRVQSSSIPVVPVARDGEQASGGPTGTRDKLAWKTTRRGMVWKFRIGEFPLPEGEVIYSNAVVAHESEHLPQQGSLWGNTA